MEVIGARANRTQVSLTKLDRNCDFYSPFSSICQRTNKEGRKEAKEDANRFQDSAPMV